MNQFSKLFEETSDKKCPQTAVFDLVPLWWGTFLSEPSCQTEWCLHVCKNFEQLQTKQSLRCVHMTHWSCANRTWKQCIFTLKSGREWCRFHIILHPTMVKCIQSHSVYVNVASMCRLFDLIFCNCTGWHVAQDYFCCPEARRKSERSGFFFLLSFSHFQPFHILPPSPRSSVSLHAN